MNILLISGLYESKPKSGGSYLMQQYVMELRRLGHRVWLFYFTSNDSPPQLPATEADTWYLPDVQQEYLAGRSIKHKVSSKLSGWYKQTTNETSLQKYFYRDFSWFQPAIEKLIDTNQVDVIQVDFPWMMNVVSFLNIKAPKVFVSHEAQFVLKERKGENDVAKQCAHIETSLAHKYDKVLTLTPVEAELWQKADTTLSVQYSPMGLALPKVEQPIAPAAHKLIFVGSSKHQPNLDGIRFFLNDIWPVVKAHAPELTIDITGEHDDSFKQEFENVQDINWLGFVPSLQKVMHGAISIVPIRLGSGIRVKIIEAMAYGVPVVATPLAAEGISVAHNQSIMLSDSPENFANHIVTLYNNPQKYQQLATKAQKLAIEEYDVIHTVAKRIVLFSAL